MVRARGDQPEQIARAITDTRQSIHSCNLCGFFAADEICEICADPSRSTDLLCVTEQPTDILPLEKTGHFAVDIMRSAARFRRSTMSLPKICALKNWWIASIGKKISEIIFCVGRGCRR
jgi:Recombinational DNA repair protein (RecF pathway)